MKSTTATGCAGIVILPFALFGFFFAGVIYFQAWHWYEMQHWDEVAATIDSLEMRNSARRGKKGGSSRVLAKYRYTIDGKEYTSERVGLHEFSDNIGSFQRRTYNRLKPVLHVPDGATCFVNPVQPQEAVLSRKARWEIFAMFTVFAAAFGCFGVIAVPTLMQVGRDDATIEARKESFPEEPWNWHPQWDNGQISSNQRESVRNWMLASIWWVILTIPVGVFSVMALADSDGWAMIGLLLPCLSVYVVRGWMLRRGHLRDYGVAHLQIPDFPLRAGMNTTLALVFERGELPEESVTAECICMREFPRPRKKNRREIAWQDRQQIGSDDGRMISGGLWIALPLEIPRQISPTSLEGITVKWTLTVTVPTRTAPLKLEFALPVF